MYVISISSDLMPRLSRCALFALSVGLVKQGFGTSCVGTVVFTTASAVSCTHDFLPLVSCDLCKFVRRCSKNFIGRFCDVCGDWVMYETTRTSMDRLRWFCGATPCFWMGSAAHDVAS